MKQKLYKIICNILRFFTRIYLWRTKPYVVGITWSVGKTCCRDVITQVLRAIQTEKIIYTSPKNYNSEIGLIFSIFQIDDYNPGVKSLLQLTLTIAKKSLFQKKQYDVLVAEYGIDSPKDMDFLISVMKPDISILTKLDSVHSDNFPRGIDQYWEDKWKLLLVAKKKVFFNALDSFSLQNEHLLSKPYEKIFSTTVKTKIEKTEAWITQSFVYKKKEISINLLWDENIEYTLLGLKIAQWLGIKISEDNYSFDYTLQPGRFNIFERNETIFIDSTYNAGPESMKKIIENTKLVQRELYPEHKIIYALWDMREIGVEKISAHESLANIIKDASAIMLVWPDTYSYTLPELKVQNFTGDIHSSLSSREVWKYLKKYLKDNKENKYIVLCKGSQNTIFMEETLVPQLLMSQQKSLPRQTGDWKTKKDDFFKNL